MEQLAFDEKKIKEIFISAFDESIQKNREVFHDIFYDVIEDIGLINAIKEGENSGKMSRDEVFSILEGKS